MKKILGIVVYFSIVGLAAQSPLELSVLKKVKMEFSKGRGATFSSLYNNDAFNGQEKEFLGRLYEVFFAIPVFLRDEYSSTRKIPTKAEIADNFGVSVPSIDLLLMVTEIDGRVPSLFKRNSETGEITSLNLDNIAAFIKNKGDQVKMAQWEGKPIPSFQLETFDEKSFGSKALFNQNSLVYFWFTGCPPCVKIAPILADLHKRYPTIQFVGINADELLELGTSNESRKAYAKKQGITFVQLNLDEKTKVAFGNVNLYPTLFFVGKDGNVRRHLVNFQAEDKLVGIIDEMLSD